MTAEQIKLFFNKHFFDGNNPIPKVASLSIKIEKDHIEIPNIQISPDHTIESIFKGYFHHVSDLPNSSTNPPVEQPASDVTTFINVEQIEYRKNFYSVEEHINEKFIVRNNNTGKVLDEDSVVHRSLVKKYKDIA
jgi:hypothetical protein